MAYHSTPHFTTGYSPFYLLDGREKVTPANKNLKAKVPRRTQPVEEQMENLKVRLRLAYKAVAAVNKGAHGSNKRRYDRKAQLRSFEEGIYVYLYNPAVRPRRSKKVYHFGQGYFG
jgi:hypothetical protein